jgi:hypothetical protein
MERDSLRLSTETPVVRLVITKDVHDQRRNLLVNVSRFFRVVNIFICVCAALFDPTTMKDRITHDPTAIWLAHYFAIEYVLLLVGFFVTVMINTSRATSEYAPMSSSNEEGIESNRGRRWCCRIAPPKCVHPVGQFFVRYSRFVSLMLLIMLAYLAISGFAVAVSYPHGHYVNYTVVLSILIFLVCLLKVKILCDKEVVTVQDAEQRATDEFVLTA